MTGGCGGGVELSAANSICSCPNPEYIVRPCIGNANWGGVNTATCGGDTQTMTVVFEAGPDCELVRKFKVKCGNNKLRVKIKSSLPEGTKLTVVVNGEEHWAFTNRRGIAKLKLRNQTGKKVVSIQGCDEFEKEVDCGE